MPKNKIITRKNGVDTALLDVSGTTATEEKVLKGEVFTKADGTIATGTLEGVKGYKLTESADKSEATFTLMDNMIVKVSSLSFDDCKQQTLQYLNR